MTAARLPPTTADVLRRVHRNIRRLDARDWIAVETLLRSRKTQHWAPGEQPAALASLLARDKDEWREIHAAARGVLPEVPPPSPEPVPQPEAPSPPVHLEPISRRDRLTAALRARGARLRNRIADLPRALVLAALLAGIVGLVGGGAWAVYRILSPDPVETRFQGEEAETLDEELEGRIWALQRVVEPLEHGVREFTPPVSFPPSLALPLAIASALFLLLGLRWLLLPPIVDRHQREETRRRREHADDARAELEEKTAAEGRPLQVPYKADPGPPFAVRVLEDTATALGRLQRGLPGRELDPVPTVERSIEAGGRFVPAWALRTLPHTYVVLLDEEKGDHPWLAGCWRVLRAWRRLGLRLRVVTYRYEPGKVTDPETGRDLSLEELGRLTDGEPLLILSRTLSRERYEGGAHWLHALGAWPLRAWLDLDPTALEKRSAARRRDIRGLAHRGLPRFPWSEAGVQAMARFLGRGTPPAPGAFDPLPPLPPRTGSDPQGQALRRWALAAALVPDPGWDQLQVIRQHFHAEIGRHLPDFRWIERLLQWIEREAGDAPAASPDRNRERSVERDGFRLYIPEGVVDDLIREQRDLEARAPEGPDAGFERRARELILSQIAEEKPEDPLDAQWWRFKQNQHRAVLEPERARKLLGWVFDAAIAHEATRWVVQEVQRQDRTEGPRFGKGLREDVREAEGTGAGVPPRALLGWVPGSRLRAAAYTAGVLLLAALQVGWLVPGWLQARAERGAGTVPAILPATYRLEEVDLAALRPEMVAVPFEEGAVTFTMGSEGEMADGDETVHTVRLTRPFAIARTEVTQAQYRAVMGEEPFVEEYKGVSLLGDALPAQNVSWFDAVRYCNRLTALENEARRAQDPPMAALETVYWADEEHTERYEGGEEVYRKPRATGYRLPTEAEWEYAARAGTHEVWAGTDEEGELHRYANLADRSAKDAFDFQYYSEVDDGYPALAPVGSFRPNAWALYDMSGNVWEWCGDWYGEYEAGEDPTGPGSGGFRVVRGGAWGDPASNLRVSHRDWWPPSHRSDNLGFRPARSWP